MIEAAIRIGVGGFVFGFVMVILFLISQAIGEKSPYVKAYNVLLWLTLIATFLLFNYMAGMLVIDLSSRIFG